MISTFWQNRNVLVTGATGLLGSWMVEDLLDRQANVVAIVRDGVPRSKLALSGVQQRINVVNGDIEDFRLIERTLAEYEVTSVFHLAAQTQVLVANRSPLSTFESNVRGTYLLMEACRVNPAVKSIVVASSDKAYGSAEHLPYDETTPLRGVHPYDVSKSCADLITNSYAHSFGLPVCITRCGNLYGGGDLNWARIIPGTIRSIWQNQAPIIRSDGTLIRDYFYVRDAVDAYLMLAEQMETKGIRGEAYNFSNEIQLSVLALTQKLLILMGREDLQPIVQGNNRGEIKDQWLSAAKARDQLSWHPRFELDSALAETIEWYKHHLQGPVK